MIKEREKHIFRFVLPVIYRFSLLSKVETNFYHNNRADYLPNLFSNAVKENILSAIIFHFIIGFSVIVAGSWPLVILKYILSRLIYKHKRFMITAKTIGFIYIFIYKRKYDPFSEATGVIHKNDLVSTYSRRLSLRWKYLFDSYWYVIYLMKPSWTILWFPNCIYLFDWIDVESFESDRNLQILEGLQG